jgi:hypothetical protein
MAAGECVGPLRNTKRQSKIGKVCAMRTLSAAHSQATIEGEGSASLQPNSVAQHGAQCSMSKKSRSDSVNEHTPQLYWHAFR